MHLATKIASAVLATMLATAPVYAVAADPTGTWQADDGKSRYKVTSCGDHALCARLIWLRDKNDVNRQYLNQVIVQGTQSAENKWTGTVKHAGDVYSGTMIMTGKDSLKVNGCQGVFCQTVNLSRV
ncbi:MAG: DUF2147 domain-containing protein [Devosia sp.]|uniref:DUF2147 domain-containing protein n=1 Tax=Devosia sp. TaxID=1871048 RepID=UPI001AC629D2|nr:DUF2147 domain-containing protein [Devosia sp.]MBN9310697.1 DUF2147 domain-containing protein [Devosia sp.]MBN9317329.1 DUF2147 domain-containing protein [Devosia sp.]